MPNNAAVILSATAAFFAAVCSFLIYKIHRRNLVESLRPELVLTEWIRHAEGQGDAAHEVITFKSIKNVGRGVAFHIHLDAINEVSGRPTAFLATTRIPILAPNEANVVDGKIRVWWKNVEPDEQTSKNVLITIPIFCLDSRSVRYETRYNLLISELAPNVHVANEIAPGVGLGSRRTTSTPLWRLRLVTKLERIPGLGRLFHKNG